MHFLPNAFLRIVRTVRSRLTNVTAACSHPWKAIFKRRALVSPEFKARRSTDLKPSTRMSEAESSIQDQVEAPSRSPNSGGESSAAPVDPFAYLNRDEFTSEIYKIVIKNVKKFPGFRKINTLLLERCGFEAKKVRYKGTVSRSPPIFVTFQSKEEQEKAVELLNGFEWNDNILSVKIAPPSPDPLLLKRRREASSDNPAKRAKPHEEDTRTLVQKLNAAVTPYHEKSYEEQLRLKQEDMTVELRKMVSLFFKHQNVPPWLHEASKANAGMPCPLLDIIPSPVTRDYRNKSEFTIGRGHDGELTVGFRYGSYRDNMLTIVEPSECLHISTGSKAVAKALQEYLRQSGKSFYDEVSHDGYWQQATVRTSSIGDCMVMLQLHSQEMTQDDFEAEKVRIVDYFVKGEGASCPITSFYLCVNKQRYQNVLVEDGCHHVFGKKYVEHSVLDQSFRVSPMAFFQVNVPATELLYSKVREWCNVGENTILLDICCGTGTIGQAMAKSVKHVVGIEMVEDAIEDANFNARMNGIGNVEYICGKAEDVLAQVTARFGRGSQVIGVVDPPRAGLHPSVVEAIRRCSALKRLVYVACNIKASKDNIVYLCKPRGKAYTGNGFRPLQAVPVDLFPQTPHCELVVLLERAPLQCAQIKDCTKGEPVHGEQPTQKGGDKAGENATPSTPEESVLQTEEDIPTTETGKEAQNLEERT